MIFSFLGAFLFFFFHSFRDERTQNLEKMSVLRKNSKKTLQGPFTKWPLQRCAPRRKKKQGRYAFRDDGRCLQVHDEPDNPTIDNPKPDEGKHQHPRCRRQAHVSPWGIGRREQICIPQPGGESHVTLIKAIYGNRNSLALPLTIFSIFQPVDDERKRPTQEKNLTSAKMPRCVVVLQRLKEVGLPYVTLWCNRHRWQKLNYLSRMSSCILFLLLVVSTWLSNLAVVYESHICKLTLRGIHNFTFFLDITAPCPLY